MRRVLSLLILLNGIWISAIGQWGSTQLPDSVLYKKINQSFSSLATGQSDAINLVNYGSFDPVNGQFKLNVFGPLSSVNKEKVAFYSVSVGGKLIGENSGVLFNNSKFNAGMTAGLKIHIPFGCNTVHFLASEEKNILQAIRVEEQKKNAATASAALDANQSLLIARYIQDTLKRSAFQNTLKKNRKSIDSLVGAAKQPGISDSQRLALATQVIESFKKHKQDSLDAESLNVQVEDDSLFLFSSLNPAILDLAANKASRLKDLAKQDYMRKKDSLEMTLNVSAGKTAWLSIVGDVGRNKYYTVNEGIPFSQMFRERKITTHSLGLEYNFIGYIKDSNSMFVGPPPRYHAGNIGFARIYTNNIADLTTTELTAGRKYASGDSSYSLGTKYNTYPDTAISTYRAWKLYFNYYRTFGKKEQLAWHAFTDVEFRDSEDNPVNAGLGFIFSIRNKKDRSVLVIELYGKLTDIGKALPQDESSFINRNEIGFHIGIPFNIPTLK